MNRGKQPQRKRAGGWLLGAALAVAGCGTRDRLVFPEPGNGAGPHTVILVPGGDTTVAMGPWFYVNGYMTDPDLVDTLYAETAGGIWFLTYSVDTAYFSIPLTTTGLSGQTITLRVFGTDWLGYRGDTAVRQITVQ